MFSIEADFSDADLERWIQEDLDAWFEEFIEFWKMEGRQLVDNARLQTKDDGGFGNITWNLRSSIGMCIVDATGNIIETYFPPIGKGEHGNAIGREMAENIALYARKRQEIMMVFVAAEDYAVFVEAKVDVIDHVIGNHLQDALDGLLR